MDAVLSCLRNNLSGYNHSLLFFEEEVRRLENTIRLLVLNGESNSLLLIGRRGVGKRHVSTVFNNLRQLLKEAIKRCNENKDLASGFFEVHLNGLVHTDDRTAMRSLAEQLHREALFDQLVNDSGDNKIETESDNPRSFPLSQFLLWFLSEMRSSDKSNKALLIILHEFDLFALHHNQILLYNLFDCCKSGGTPMCVIGLTCRLDVMELLEKRVKSRFSHRQIYLTSPAAPIENTDSYASDNVDEDTKSKPFDKFCHICQHLLSVNLSDNHSPIFNKSKHHGKERRELESVIKTWNQHISELMSNDIVVDTLRQAWSISVSIRRLINLLIPIVASLGPNKDRIDPVQFIDSLCSLRQDARLNSLNGLSVLELFLISSIVKLQDINDGQAVNFEILYNEYMKFCRSNCPSYLYDKAVVLKALDNLINSELIVSGKSAMVASAHPAKNISISTTNGVSTMGTISLPNYRPLFCHIDLDTLTNCLDSYPNCPMELKYWIHSRTF